MSSEDDAWVVQHEWAARSRADVVLADRDIITLGFDGSRHRSRGVTDATALVGCRVVDGHLFPIRVWEQPEGKRDWQIPTLEVDAEIAATFAKYTVVGFYADSALWETFVVAWEAKYGVRLKVKASRDHPIEWRMNRPQLVVQATGQLYSAIVDGEMTHDGSSVLTRHVLNARRRTSRSASRSRRPARTRPTRLTLQLPAFSRGRPDSMRSPPASPRCLDVAFRNESADRLKGVPWRSTWTPLSPSAGGCSTSGRSCRPSSRAMRSSRRIGAAARRCPAAFRTH